MAEYETTPPSVIVTAPRTQVFYSCIAFGAVGMLIFFVIAEPRSAFLAVLFMPYFAVLGVRGFRLRLDATPAELLIRNHFRSYSIAWSTVGQFVIERQSWFVNTPSSYGFPGTIVGIKMTDGRRIRIAATQDAGNRNPTATQLQRLTALDALLEDYPRRSGE